MKLTEQQLAFLNQHGWKTSYVNNTLEISNSKTGCRFDSPFSNEFAELFALDKIEEILEEIEADDLKLDLTENEILEEFGYTITCESPLEISDHKGSMITGECANWLKMSLIKKYTESLKMT